MGLMQDSHRSKVTINAGEDKGLMPFKVGIIGCGQVGTMILTKLIEV